MKNLFTFLLIVGLSLGFLVGCSTKKADEKNTDSEKIEEIELIVFAAASMTETLTEISYIYKKVAPNVNIIYNFDSSGTLKTQIEEGADCDIFISASQKQMNQLDINTNGLDYVLEDSRFDILENKVVLVVTEGNSKRINSFDDLKSELEEGAIMLAMGNADVPVGQYTQEILKFLELNEEALASSGLLTYGSNVKEVTTQVSEGLVDCGVIYQTDAFSAGLTIVDTATAKMCGRVIYPASILNISDNVDAAKSFLGFLKSEEASKIFENVGFVSISH